MGIVKNSSNISEVNINNKNISEIYYGNTLVYSSVPKIAEVVFRDIDENDNLTQATGSLDGLFNNIKTIDMYGLYYAFYNCTGITGNISFPALTTVNSNGLFFAFYGCTGITELHFRADVKSAVEAANGYWNKFGASNATIYFDL